MPKLTGTSRSGTTWTMTGGNERAGGGLTRKNWRISGINDVTAGINAELMRMRIVSGAALVDAARIVLNDTKYRTSPLVPVGVTGKLIASSFQHERKKPISGDPYVELGFNSNYAAAVHEMMESPSGKPINWTRPDSGPKFLERSLERNAKLIVEMVRSKL